MKWIIGLSLLLLSSFAQAELVDFPVCMIDGVPVIYLPMKPSKKFPSLLVADSSMLGDQRLIRFNYPLLDSKPKEWQMQVLLHECGHHVESTKPNPLKTSEELELSVDCYSAIVLREKYSYGKKEFDIIINTMLSFLPIDRVIAFDICSRN